MVLNHQQVEANGNRNSADLDPQIWGEDIAGSRYVDSYFLWGEDTAGCPYLNSNTNSLTTQDYQHQHFPANQPSCAYSSAITNPSSLPHNYTNTPNDPDWRYFNTSPSSESNVNRHGHQTVGAYSNTTWSPARPVQVRQNTIDEASNTLASQQRPSGRFQSNRFREHQNQNYSPASSIGLNSYDYSRPFLHSSNASREGVARTSLTQNSASTFAPSSYSHVPGPVSAEQVCPQAVVPQSSSLIRAQGPYNFPANNTASTFPPSSYNHVPGPLSAEQVCPQAIVPQSNSLIRTQGPYNFPANNTASTFPPSSYNHVPAPLSAEQVCPQAIVPQSSSLIRAQGAYNFPANNTASTFPPSFLSRCSSLPSVEHFSPQAVVSTSSLIGVQGSYNSPANTTASTFRTSSLNRCSSLPSAQQSHHHAVMSTSRLIQGGVSCNPPANNTASTFCTSSLNRISSLPSTEQLPPHAVMSTSRLIQQVPYNPLANNTTSTIPSHSSSSLNPSSSRPSTEQRLPEAVASKSSLIREANSHDFSTNNAASTVPSSSAFSSPLICLPRSAFEVTTETYDQHMIQDKATESSSAHPLYQWMGQRQSSECGKRKRQSYTLQQTTRLETVFRQHGYVTRNVRDELCKELGLTEKQVKTWFQNRRMKSKKEKTEQNHSNKPRPEQSSADLPEDCYLQRF